MKRIILFVICSVFPILSMANGTYPLPLNIVSMQLSQERWVTTDTVKVLVSVNATLNHAEIGALRTQILSNLKTVSPDAAWHVVNFSQSQDQSGLVQLNVLAETRMAGTELGGIFEKLKNSSKAGETYRVVTTDFVPSPQEFLVARAELRQNIYEQAHEELKRLNNVYPDQKYYLHDIQFDNMQPEFLMAQQSYSTKAVSAPHVGMQTDDSSAAVSVSVSHKLEITARVSFASLTPMQGK